MLASSIACEGSAPVATKHGFPATGLVLLSLVDGKERASAPVGTDPVAVIVSEDGSMAYVADSSPGDVYAVRLPDLSVAWRQHVGGAPFGLLLSRGHLMVSLFSGAAVVELDPVSGARVASHPMGQGPGEMSVAADGRVIVAETNGSLGYLDGTSIPAGQGFAVAVVGRETWTADYKRAQLVRAGDDHRVALPLAVSPFWLAPGITGKLLVAAEGANEDGDPGAVFAFDTATGTFATLARPRDPDQVLQTGSNIFVAAHGDREVLAFHGGEATAWAPGAAAVAVAADPALNLLVLAVNEHE